MVLGAEAIDGDGNLTFNDMARHGNEIWVDAGGLKAPGAKPAAEVTFGILETPAWQFADEAVEGNEETISFSMRLPTRMDRSVAPTLGIGWSTTTVDPGNDSEQAEWQLEYLWTSPDANVAAAADETLYVTSSASTATEGLVFAVVTGIDVPSATDVCMHCRLKRLSSASAGNSADTIADDIELHGVCFRWTSNKLGAPL